MFSKIFNCLILSAILFGAARSGVCALGNPTLSVMDQVGLSQANPPTKLWVYGAVNEAVTNTQTGGWIDLQGASAFNCEILQGQSSPVTAGTGYMGSYQIQVSNDQSSVYTVWQDNNPTIIQNYSYCYTNHGGWRYVRAVCNPVTGNTGILTIKIKTYGNDNAKQTDVTGVADLGPSVIFNQVAANFTAAVTFTDFKVPAGYTGIEFYINCTALTGTSFTPTFYRKDPVSGLYITAGTGVAVSSTGNTMVKIARGLTAAGGVFSDSITPNMAFAIAVSSFTSATATITAVFTR